MKTIALMLFACVALAAQVLPAPTTPGTRCTYEVLADGRIAMECDNTPGSTDLPADKPDYRDKFIVLCQSRINGVNTTITIDVLSIELQFISLPALTLAVAPLNPSNPAPGAILYSQWNLPNAYQTQQLYTVTKAQWDALPEADRWAAVKQQPPMQYARLPITGACAARILQRLRAGADEPL